MSTLVRQAREYDEAIAAARKAAGRLAARRAIDGDQIGERRAIRVRDQLRRCAHATATTRHRSSA
ncbi:hypothetical protein [Mycobacterium sp.]|uniref:hypothetical protein n=1 Tax=Mycobacterium sp. TaxID=1785 RepID=UPI00263336F3|nr:hypothetical protein [Mycobacterium sp.]